MLQTPTWTHGFVVSPHLNQGVAFVPDQLELPSQNLFAAFSEEKDLNKLTHLLHQLH
jgi:hypothetical protein